MTREINPRLVFERLFASELPQEASEGDARGGNSFAKASSIS